MAEHDLKSAEKSVPVDKSGHSFTPGYLLASHLRDMAKTSYEPPVDHVGRLYEAAARVDQHADLLKALRRFDDFAWSAVTTDCDESRLYLQQIIDQARAALSRARGES